MYSDAQKMFLLCKRDVQPVGTDRIYLLQGKKKKKIGWREALWGLCLAHEHNQITRHYISGHCNPRPPKAL